MSTWVVFGIIGIFANPVLHTALSGEGSSSEDTAAYGIEALNFTPEDDESGAFELGLAAVELNTASRQELLTLPTMNDAYVQAILKTRPYQTWDDLQSRSQLPDLVIQSIKPYATLMVLLPHADLVKQWQGEARAITWYHSEQPFGTGALQLQLKGPLANAAGFLTLMQASDFLPAQQTSLGDVPAAFNSELALAYVQAQVGPWVGIVGSFNVGFGQRLVLDTSHRVAPDGFYVNHTLREDIFRGKVSAKKALTGLALTYQAPSGNFLLHSFVGNQSMLETAQDSFLIGAHAMYRYSSRMYVGTTWHQQPWHADPRVAKSLNFGMYGALGVGWLDTVFELAALSTGGFAAVAQSDIWLTKKLSLQVAGSYYGVGYNNFYSLAIPALYGMRAYHRRNNQRLRVGLQASMQRWFTILQIEQGSPVGIIPPSVDKTWQPWRVQKLQHRVHVRVANGTILKTRLQLQQTHLLSYDATGHITTRPLASLAIGTEPWQSLQLGSALSWRMISQANRLSHHFRASIRMALVFFDSTWFLARLHVNVATSVPMLGRTWLWQASVGLRQAVGPYVTWQIHTGVVKKLYDPWVWMSRLFLQVTY